MTSLAFGLAWFHARSVVLGFVLVALGVVVVVIPQLLVAVGSRYRIWMGTIPSASSVRAARIAAAVVVIVGLVLIAAA